MKLVLNIREDSVSVRMDCLTSLQRICNQLYKQHECVSASVNQLPTEHTSVCSYPGYYSEPQSLDFCFFPRVTPLLLSWVPIGDPPCMNSSKQKKMDEVCFMTSVIQA